MKGLVKIIWVIGFLVFAVSGISFAQQDKAGCKDHPMFTRMENFYIEHCKEEKFDEVDFKDEKGKKIKVEGRVFKIDYHIKKGFTPPSGLQVIRNYENAIKKIGGVKVFQDKTLKLYVVGHTDNMGTIDYNLKLSKVRADAVVRELTTKYKISADRLRAFGVASLAPVESNKTEEGRAKNRRVELVEQ